jgi:replication factor A2
MNPHHCSNERPVSNSTLYIGGGGGGSQGGGGGGGNRRSYDEQTLTPITASMALATNPDESGSMQLTDGRKLYHVKLVGAVRSVEDFSTNVVYEVEDGTGLVEVKQWLDENDNSAIQEMRKETLRDNIYVRIVGTIKEYDGKKTIMADTVRPLTTGNQLAHHMLEVVYAAENSTRKNNIVAPAATGMMQGVGFGGGNAALQNRGAPLAAASSGGGGLRDSVLQYIQQQGDMTEAGANLQECIRMLSSQHSEGAIRKVIDDLAAEGHIYSTIDENNYKSAM